MWANWSYNLIMTLDEKLPQVSRVLCNKCCCIPSNSFGGVSENKYTTSKPWWLQEQVVQQNHWVIISYWGGEWDHWSCNIFLHIHVTKPMWADIHRTNEMKSGTHEGLIRNGDLDNAVTRRWGRNPGSTDRFTCIYYSKSRLDYSNLTGHNSTKLLLLRDSC